MDSFRLNGRTYYQEGRKCGSANCRCASGQLHGPYWWQRDESAGKRTYIGKELPAGVHQARAMRDALLPQIGADIDELYKLLDALRRLRAGDSLDEDDTRRLAEHGYKLGLV